MGNLDKWPRRRRQQGHAVDQEILREESYVSKKSTVIRTDVSADPCLSVSR